MSDSDSESDSKNEITVSSNPKKIEELCFAGAANRGICYVGVLKCLEDHNLLNLKKIVAVSIGSLIGLCYSIGFSADDLFDEILEKDLSELQDISFNSVVNSGSVLQGNNYRMWVWDLISKKTDPMITFETLKSNYNIDMTVIATCLDSGEDGLATFGYTHTPKMPIYYAIIASMTVPFIFPPLVYNNKRYVDGGVLENFPMYLLSKDAVGFRVKSKPIEADVTNTTYFFKLINLMTTYMRKTRKFEGNGYTIDASDYSTINFSMNIDNKITLYYRGYKTTLKCVQTLRARSEGTVQTLRARSEGTVQTLRARSEGTIQTLRARSEGTVQTLRARSEGTVEDN